MLAPTVVRARAHWLRGPWAGCCSGTGESRPSRRHDLRHQVTLIHRRNGSAVAGCNWVDLPKRSSSATLVVGANGSRKRHSGCKRARRSAVSSRKGMPTLSLAGSIPAEGPPTAPQAEAPPGGEGRQIRHQIANHAAAGLITDRQLALHRLRHGRDPIVPAWPAGHPFRIVMAIAGTGRAKRSRTGLHPGTPPHPSGARGRNAVDATAATRSAPAQCARTNPGAPLPRARARWLDRAPTPDAKPPAPLTTVDAGEGGVQPFRKRPNPGGQLTWTVQTRTTAGLSCFGDGRGKKCGWRDLNSQGRSHTPPNVRVYQFHHIRVVDFCSGVVESDHTGGVFALGFFGRRDTIRRQA